MNWMLNITSFTTRTLKNKGYTFIGNLTIICVFAWLKFSSPQETQRIFSSLALAIRNLFPFLILIPPIFLGNKFLNRIVFAAFILIFILGESLARFGFFNRVGLMSWDGSDFYRYPKPYVEFLGKPNSLIPYSPYKKMGGTSDDATIKLNSLGLRGELPNPNKGDEYRIIVLGGSTVFNGAPLPKSISGEIEKLFHDDGFNNVKVYNWGVVSFNSAQELSLLVHYASGYDPDLILTYDGANDVYDSFVYDSRPGYPYNWRTYESGLKIIRGNPSTSQIVDMLLLKSQFITSIFGESLRNRIVGIRWEEPYSDNDLDYLSLSTTSAYMDNLKKMCNYSKGNNFKFVAVLQPMLVFKNPLVGDENKFLEENSIQLRSYIKKSYQLLNNDYQNLENSSNNGDCYYLDMSKIFSSYDKETYWDIVHTDNNGNKHISEQIYYAIKKNFESLKIKE